MVPTYTNEEYARAYTEVLGMIKYFSSESLEKIPEDVIHMYEENKDENYDFEFDRNKSFDDQDISKLAKILIANIFADYIATEEEREYLNYRDKQELEKIEEEKKKIYNTDNIFARRKQNLSNQIIEENDEEINNSIITVNENENVFKKIMLKIMKLFKK